MLWGEHLNKKTDRISRRIQSEIEHGKWLSENNAEENWGWSTFAGQLRFIRRAELLANEVSLRPGITALEVGCGTGVFSEEFVKSGCDLLAVDISRDLISIATQRNLAEKNLRFISARFEDIDIEGSFDAVLGSGVLHHLELNKALEKIFHLLKPGGRIAFTEPNLLNPQVLAYVMLSKLRVFPSMSPNETGFIRWRIRKQLKKIGFKEVNIIPFDWLHPKTPRIITKAVLNIGALLEKTPVVCELSGSLFISGKRPA